MNLGALAPEPGFLATVQTEPWNGRAGNYKVISSHYRRFRREKRDQEPCKMLKTKIKSPFQLRHLFYGKRKRVETIIQ